MKYPIHRVVVIGAGTMGAGIAAHLANAGVPVTLLDIVPDKLTEEEEKKGLSLADRVVRDRIVQQGLERAIKARPANFFTPDHVALVKTGNLEDDFAAVGEADWVIEAILENLKVKRVLMERIDAVRSPHTIISTNTSGIPVNSIVAGFSEGLRQHFLGTHFFNPPRYMKLLEVIPAEETLAEVVYAITHFAEVRLGKGVVPAKDTPNFVANRLAFGTAPFGLDYILEHGYTVQEVDALTGPLIGRPKTATFRLIDLVGVDVWEAVGRNLAPAIPHDEQAQRYLSSSRVNDLIRNMLEKGWLGNKSKGGFYKEVRQPEGGKEFWALNLQTFEYEPPQKVRFESVGEAKDVAGLGERLKILLKPGDRAGQLVKALTFQSLAYASTLIPEVSDTPRPIDDAMRWGFNVEAGPFETWDMLGVEWALECMQPEGYEPAAWVAEMLLSGHTTFYQYERGTKVGVYDPARGGYQPFERKGSPVLLKERKNEGQVIRRNASASLVDIGQGVACLEFHTKMNVLEEETFTLLEQALDLVEQDYEGLVIGNEADNFSAGANVFMIVVGAQNGMWDQIEAGVKRMQDTLMRVRYFPKPVVVAPAGLALGGGSEVIMHGSRVVAAAELYAGLVEIGVGVIPAGGGTKEMVRRVLNPPMRTQNAAPLPYLQRIFEQIGQAKVATSAEEARQLGLLSPCDRVVMNRDHLLSEARREVLHMVEGGYRPPLPELVYAAGRDALAALRVGVYMFKEGNFITEHEALIAGKLATVMTGGEFSQPAWVPEQVFLDLEREAFLSLVGEEKTQQRMWNILQTGKVLRN